MIKITLRVLRWLSQLVTVLFLGLFLFIGLKAGWSCMLIQYKVFSSFVPNEIVNTIWIVAAIESFKIISSVYQRVFSHLPNFNGYKKTLVFFKILGISISIFASCFLFLSRFDNPELNANQDRIEAEITSRYDNQKKQLKAVFDEAVEFSLAKAEEELARLFELIEIEKQNTYARSDSFRGPKYIQLEIDVSDVKTEVANQRKTLGDQYFLDLKLLEDRMYDEIERVQENKSSYAENGDSILVSVLTTLKVGEEPSDGEYITLAVTVSVFLAVAMEGAIYLALMLILFLQDATIEKMVQRINLKAKSKHAKETAKDANEHYKDTVGEAATAYYKSVLNTFKSQFEQFRKQFKSKT